MLESLWTEWMKAYKPKQLASLERSGRREAEEKAFGERAQLAFSSALSDLKRQNPAPAAYLEVVQHEQNLRAMAREQVIADLLPTPNDTAEEEPEMTIEEADEVLRGFFRTLGPEDESA